MEMLAGYTREPKALRSPRRGPARRLVVLSPDILKALHTALEQVLDERPRKSEQFQARARELRAFRAEQHRWFWIADARAEMSVYALTDRPIDKPNRRRAGRPAGSDRNPSCHNPRRCP